VEAEDWDCDSNLVVPHLSQTQIGKLGKVELIERVISTSRARLTSPLFGASSRCSPAPHPVHRVLANRAAEPGSQARLTRSVLVLAARNQRVSGEANAAPVEPA
jgi:hypothetical protein